MPDSSAQMTACIPRLRRYARALLGERGAADDLVQDTIERGWQKLASWHPGSDMRPWLFSIMHNLYIDQLRRPSVPTVAYDDDTPVPPQPHSDTLGLRDLDAALAQLPPEQRAVLLLVGLEELRYDEVASVLGIPAGTVMSRLSRGRERLRLLMQGQPASPPLRVVK